MRLWTYSAGLAVVTVVGAAALRPAAAQTETSLAESQQTQSAVYMRNDAPSAIGVTELLGSAVRTTNNEEIGEIEDLIVENGKVETVVLSLGGLLGIGDRLVGVPYSDLRKADDGDTYVIAKSTSELSGLVEFERPRNTSVTSSAAGTASERPAPTTLPAQSPPPLNIDPDLAEIDPRLATGVAANEAAFGEQLDHEAYDNDNQDDNEGEVRAQSKGKPPERLR